LLSICFVGEKSYDKFVNELAIGPSRLGEDTERKSGISREQPGKLGEGHVGLMAKQVCGSLEEMREIERK